MGKEQELRPCPFCGGEGLVYQLKETPKLWRVVCKNCDAGPAASFSSLHAASGWNRRSSDEQAEVVGHIDGASGQWVGPFTACNKCGCTELVLKGKFRCCAKCGVSYGEHAKLASPPAVAAGGVTEELVEASIAAMRESLGYRHGNIIHFGSHHIDLRILARAALTAALALREGGLFPVTLGKINQAIDGYVQALVDRQHGGVAQDRAFNAICEALGRSPTAEMDARRLPTPPSRGEGV